MLQSQVKQEPLDRRITAPLFAVGLGGLAWYQGGVYFSVALLAIFNLPWPVSWVLYVALSSYEWYYIPSRRQPIYATAIWLIVVGLDVGAAFVGLTKDLKAVKIPFFAWQMEIGETNAIFLLLAFLLAFAPEPLVRTAIKDFISGLFGGWKFGKSNSANPNN